MDFLRPPQMAASPLALFPGAFNPPTKAHLTLARNALDHAGAVVFLLPRSFPHKEWQGPSMDERVHLLLAAAAGEPRFGLAVSDGGLFLDMAREARRVLPQVDNVLILCGADAARRAAAWDYAGVEPFERQLSEFGLLVAPRYGVWQPDEILEPRVQALKPTEDLETVSSTAIRVALAQGKPWRHWVPEAIQDEVERLYSGLRFSMNERSR